ncbi:hypothetical protein ACOMHN_009393 [Nucella lapillus]
MRSLRSIMSIHCSLSSVGKEEPARGASQRSRRQGRGWYKVTSYCGRPLAQQKAGKRLVQGDIILWASSCPAEGREEAGTR